MLYFPVQYTINDLFYCKRESYLSERRQLVSMGGHKSKIGSVKFRVPQGSLLSPFLLCMYIFPLGHHMTSLGLNYHTYADDTQLYSKSGDYPAVAFLEHCISEIKIWLSKFSLPVIRWRFSLLAQHTNFVKLDL